MHDPSVQESIELWMKQYLANLLSQPEDHIDVRAPFSRLGLDSAAGAAMTGELAEWLACELDPTIVFDHPSIAQLSAALALDPRVVATRSNRAAAQASGARQAG